MSRSFVLFPAASRQQARQSRVSSCRPAVASYLQQHADRLRSVPEHGVFYFVSTPFITAVMTKRFNDLPIFDPFGETWT